MDLNNSYHGFCFSQIGKELEITELVEDDFALFLSAYAKAQGFTDILVDLKSRVNMRYGIEQLIKDGLNVIVMDNDYSPVIHDQQLKIKCLPVNVARSWSQFEKMHPKAIVTTSKLIERFVQSRKLDVIKTYFIPGVTDQNVKIVGRIGWYIIICCQYS